MALRRSKTAPQSLDQHDTRPATLTRVKSSMNDILHPPSRTLSIPRKVVSLSGTPHEKDPFSLAGFFPPSSWMTQSLHEGERWWLRQEEPECTPTRDELCSVYSLSEDEVDGSLPPTPGPGVFARSDKDMAEEAIKREDKMGVLSLNTLFLTDDIHAREDRLYSPYAEEEAVDHESLYLALSKRRRAECARPVNAGSGSKGELLGATEELTDSAAGPGHGHGLGILQWALAVARGIVP
ncbi:hypothetical protein BS17DRAFT_688315 [Gyrodon lividus]|nr:hypothetical protein BS17DRAFT_688315 [Gyrodon lividus]